MQVLDSFLLSSKADDVLLFKKALLPYVQITHHLEWIEGGQGMKKN